jgi:hypothetical protein
MPWILSHSSQADALLLHVSNSAGVGLDDIVGEVNEELSKAAFGGGVVSEDGREGGVA